MIAAFLRILASVIAHRRRLTVMDFISPSKTRKRRFRL